MKASSAAELLGRARAALEQGAHEDAVAPLLAVWRVVKDPRVADLLDTVSARITRPALTSPTQKQLVAQFVALVVAGDPLDQPRLVATIGTTRSPQMVEQLEALIEHGAADPRFTRPLVELLKRPPFIGSGTQSAWRRLFKLLQTYGDARASQLLRSLDVPRLLGENAAVSQGGAPILFFVERVAATAAAIEKAHAKAGVPAVPADAEAELATLAVLLAPSTATTLLAEVHANPAEPGAREVLADHLLEASDVRGQFIMLQRARAAGTLDAHGIEAERALLQAHGVRWLGELAPLVDPEAMRFEEGFLAWCAIDPDRLGLVKELTGHPSWSTVRAIHLDGRAFPHELLVDPVMRSLEVVTGIREAGVDHILGTHHVYPWQGVGIDAGGRLAELAERLPRAFPRLTELHLRAADRTVGDFAFVWDRGLSTIGFFAAHPLRVPGLLETALARTPPSTVIDFTEYQHLGYQLRLSNGRRDLDVRSRSAWGRKLASIGDLVRAAAPLAGTLGTIRIHGRSTKLERTMVQTLLAPGGDLVLVG